MIFKVSSGALRKELSRAFVAIKPNSIVPICANFKFQLEGNNLTVTATDLETTIMVNLVVQGEKDGVICIDANILTKYLKSLPEQPLLFEIDMEDCGVNIKNITGKCKVVGEDATPFPVQEDLNAPQTLSINSNLLKSVFVVGSACTISEDIGRPYFEGVSVKFLNGQMIVCSCDAFQLVRKKNPYLTKLSKVIL